MPVASDWDYVVNLNNMKWTLINYMPANPPRYSSIGWVLNPEFPKTQRDIHSSSQL